jgi:hypothetical protein
MKRKWFSLFTKLWSSFKKEKNVSFPISMALCVSFLKSKLKEQQSSSLLSTKEEAIIKNIRSITRHANINNITRTNAYLDFFKQHPSIHWALLAHFVSRNGGYHMTDLEGSLIPHILKLKNRKAFFLFLERANALIFHDAFPQLLLFKESTLCQKPLFHLLPFFNVSCFMEKVWNVFWEYPNSEFLTTALIINEQHHLEQKLVTTKVVQQNVLRTWPFLLQQSLGLTEVLLPSSSRLFSITVNDFSSLTERIKVGKMLYSILYDRVLFDDFLLFATSTIHRGSREDYAEHLFSTVEMQKTKLYSPPLKTAWSNVVHPSLPHQDWYKNDHVLALFASEKFVIPRDITASYSRKIKALNSLSHTLSS